METRALFQTAPPARRVWGRTEPSRRPNHRARPAASRRVAFPCRAVSPLLRTSVPSLHGRGGALGLVCCGSNRTRGCWPSVGFRPVTPWWRLLVKWRLDGGGCCCHGLRLLRLLAACFPFTHSHQPVPFHPGRAPHRDTCCSATAVIGNEL